jgi:hypothetical protein
MSIITGILSFDQHHLQTPTNGSQTLGPQPWPHWQGALSCQVRLYATQEWMCLHALPQFMSLPGCSTTRKSGINILPGTSGSLSATCLAHTAPVMNGKHCTLHPYHACPSFTQCQQPAVFELSCLPAADRHTRCAAAAPDCSNPVTCLRTGLGCEP